MTTDDDQRTCHDAYAGKITCDECPWRTDVPAGRFPRSRYFEMAGTSLQGFGAIFTCHKTSPGGAEHACVGWLMVDGRENLNVRVALAEGRFDPEQLTARGPLYDSYGAMAEANGVPAVVVDALGVRSARRPGPSMPGFQW